MDSPLQRSSEPRWIHQVVPRVLTWWPVKMTGTTLGMAAFFLAYFWLLRNPIHPVTVMPLTALDHWIPLWPPALPLYLSLWLYVSLAPALVVDRRELVSIGVAWGILSVIGLGVFLFWPTAVPAAAIDWREHPSLAFLKTADTAGNACPSLHVAFAVFSACWFERLLPQMGAGRGPRLANVLWCLGILYSTVATRQHVVLDVAAGAGLGLIVATVHLRWVRRNNPTPAG